jgi:DNA-binding transcriptional LysR family regulator
MSDSNSAHLRQLDMTLLLVFEGAMRSRKLTLVARDLGLTPSAASHALKRLRLVFADPLFLRRPHGLEPTARARALEPRIAEALSLLREALRDEDRFVPAEATRVFRIAALDHAAAVLGAPLGAAIAGAGPGLRLSIRALARREALAALEDGGVDLALGLFGNLPERFQHEALYEEGYAVVARPEHPAAAAGMTLQAFLAAEHVLVSLSGDLTGIVDHALAARGLSRRVAMAMPLFLPAMSATSASDLLCTLPRRLAERHAAGFGLMVFAPPLPIRPFILGAVHHRRAARDAGLAWLRSELRRISAG